MIFSRKFQYIQTFIYIVQGGHSILDTQFQEFLRNSGHPESVRVFIV